MLVVYLRFWGYLADDDLIAVHLAERLGSGKGMTLNDGEFVHGVTALLAVLLGGAAESVGLSALLVMRVHSFAATVALGWALLWSADRCGVRRTYSLPFVAVLLTALPFSLWSFTTVGGTTLAATMTWVAALLTVPTQLEVTHRRWVAALLMVTLLVRIDSMVVVAPVLLFLALRPDRRLFLKSVHLPVVGFWMLALIGQYLYFASLVPEMASTKFSLAPALLRVGGLYGVEFLSAFSPVVVACVVVLATRPGGTVSVPAVKSIGVPLIIAVVWVSYVTWVGGDWMPGYRHFALVLALLGLVILLRSPGPRVLLLATLLVASASTLSMVGEPARRALDSRSWLDNCVEGSAMLGELLKEADPLLAVEPAGCPPRVTGFAVVDMLGLFDRHIAQSELTGRAVSWTEWVADRISDATPRASDEFIPGHGKGDGEYVWNREPDVFVLCDPDNATGEGCFRSWSEIREKFDVASRYRLLAFDIGNDEPWKVWVRWDGGRTGVHYHAGGATVPVWLLAPGAGSMVGRSPDGGLVVSMSPGAQLALPVLHLPAGRYALNVPEGVHVHVPTACGFLEGAEVVLESGCAEGFVLTTRAEQPVALQPVVLEAR